MSEPTYFEACLERDSEDLARDWREAAGGELLSGQVGRSKILLVRDGSTYVLTLTETTSGRFERDVFRDAFEAAQAFKATVFRARQQR